MYHEHVSSICIMNLYHKHVSETVIRNVFKQWSFTSKIISFFFQKYGLWTCIRKMQHEHVLETCIMNIDQTHVLWTCIRNIDQKHHSNNEVMLTKLYPYFCWCFAGCYWKDYDWLIDFNGMPTSLGLFWAERLRTHEHCTFVFTFFV